MNSTIPGFRRFSTGYGVTVGIALAGLVFVSITAGAVFEARTGGDPESAINPFGLFGFLLTWTFLYLIRLIFWEKMSERRQAQMRAIVTGLLTLEVLTTVLVAVLLMAGAGRSSTDPSATTAIWTCVVAALCQIATVTWLVRYRRE